MLLLLLLLLLNFCKGHDPTPSIGPFNPQW